MRALILAGGLGSRLAAVVADRAKPVAEVGGRPFVAYLLAQLEATRDVSRVALCVGHKAETVSDALGTRFGRLPLEYSHEASPLGTGGAMRLALKRFPSREAALAMNGDSFLGIRLQRLVDFHRAARAKATLALARVAEGARFGAACLRGDEIVSFREKGATGPAWINAGIYVLSPGAAAEIAAGPAKFSFERDLLPRWCEERAVRAMKSRARFIDIGVPDDYARSARLMGRGEPSC